MNSAFLKDRHLFTSSYPRLAPAFASQGLPRTGPLQRSETSNKTNKKVRWGFILSVCKNLFSSPSITTWISEQVDADIFKPTQVLELSFPSSFFVTMCYSYDCIASFCLRKGDIVLQTHWSVYISFFLLTLFCFLSISGILFSYLSSTGAIMCAPWIKGKLCFGVFVFLSISEFFSFTLESFLSGLSIKF